MTVDQDVDIAGLLALAPSDGQYRPGGEPIALEDVDYLTIQGSHDADIRDLAGLDQYERVRFTGDEERLKAALYVGGANHTQFNADWGRYDVGFGLERTFLDIDALLEPAEQRRIARGYATVELVHRPTRTGLSEDLVLQIAWDRGADAPGVSVSVDALATGATHLVLDAVALTPDAAPPGTATVQVTDGSGHQAQLPLTGSRPADLPAGARGPRSRGARSRRRRPLRGHPAVRHRRGRNRPGRRHRLRRAHALNPRVG